MIIIIIVVAHVFRVRIQVKSEQQQRINTFNRTLFVNNIGAVVAHDIVLKKILVQVYLVGMQHVTAGARRENIVAHNEKRKISSLYYDYRKIIGENDVRRTASADSPQYVRHARLNSLRNGGFGRRGFDRSRSGEKKKQTFFDTRCCDTSPDSPKTRKIPILDFLTLKSEIGYSNFST